MFAHSVPAPLPIRKAEVYIREFRPLQLLADLLLREAKTER
jgi:hypothetical protein